MSETNFDKLASQPILLQANRVWRTYSGGKLIDQWQGNDHPEDSSFPEEWVASVVKATNVGREHIQDEGLSTIKLTDGTEVTLQEVTDSNPEAFLGKTHVEKHGSHTAVLVKLLDSSERLTIQVHPDREFAQTMFNSQFGKTEAWYVIGGRQIDGEEPYVLFGFKPGMTAEKWKELFEQQDIPGMIDALHRIPVREGEVYLVEGGVPHAIGIGCFLIEIQEPTDYTLRTEKVTPRGNIVPDQACHQGLGFENMLNCFHYDAYSLEQIKDKWFIAPTQLQETAGGSLRALIKETDTDRFTMNRLTVVSEYAYENDGTFAIAIVVQGKGKLLWGSEEISIKQGNTFFLPASLSSVKWISTDESPLEVILCYPPKP
ncbi:class I mannose-6-phosphate isomerase [Paenibacillus sp. WQ 127069]|uniref:Phosphohexomutase n=1 Tax=Paenibacillus baimaensis TaxID=2982185 RepID=A0ABT2UK00_9BACL|nr:type I phosphomannose isomerase catalytic subunit [Paenibacillus sp. WQ 127069]MCU6794970.1 class I mannose-6-phosphate isomerase [Paenibacillus sp. WQ 127069]